MKPGSEPRMSEVVCPVTRQHLRLVHDGGDFLETPDDRRYPVTDGLPELTARESRQLAGNNDQEYYQTKPREY